MDSSYIKLGPVGNSTGDNFDEKWNNQVTQIFISHNDIGIMSFQYQYVQNGNVTMSDCHGCKHNLGSSFDVVQLNYPTEYITWIAANEDVFSHNICSITIGTNRGTYGPFGRQSSNRCNKFKFQIGEGRQFGGFHGTTDGKTVKSIGIYLKPNTTLDSLDNKNIVKQCSTK